MNGLRRKYQSFCGMADKSASCIFLTPISLFQPSVVVERVSYNFSLSRTLESTWLIFGPNPTLTINYYYYCYVQELLSSYLRGSYHTFRRQQSGTQLNSPTWFWWMDVAFECCVVNLEFVPTRLMWAIFNELYLKLKSIFPGYLFNRQQQLSCILWLHAEHSSSWLRLYIRRYMLVSS